METLEYVRQVEMFCLFIYTHLSMFRSGSLVVDAVLTDTNDLTPSSTLDLADAINSVINDNTFTIDGSDQKASDPVIAVEDTDGKLSYSKTITGYI